MYIKIILFLIFIPYWSYAQSKADSLKDIKFISKDIKDKNQIIFISSPEGVKNPLYSISSCRPLEKKKVGPDQKPRTKYEPTHDYKKMVKYVKVVYFSGQRNQSVEMQVNGYHIMGNSQVPLHFELIDNCTKLRPIGFISAKDQDFIGGSKLKKGNVIRPYYLNEGIEFGSIGKDGYPGAWDEFSYDELQKKRENFESAMKLEETHMKFCIMVKNSVDDEDDPQKAAYFIYNNKVISTGKATPNFWPASSKYIRNRICSDQPEAIVDCTGSMLTRDDIRIIFNLDKIEELPEDEPSARREYQRIQKLGEKLGPKCDRAVAQYEEKTGKKVKTSPSYPKEWLQKQ